MICVNGERCTPLFSKYSTEQRLQVEILRISAQLAQGQVNAAALPNVNKAPISVSFIQNQPRRRPADQHILITVGSKMRRKAVEPYDHGIFSIIFSKATSTRSSSTDRKLR